MYAKQLFQLSEKQLHIEKMDENNLMKISQSVRDKNVPMSSKMKKLYLEMMLHHDNYLSQHKSLFDKYNPEFNKNKYRHECDMIKEQDNIRKKIINNTKIQEPNLQEIAEQLALKLESAENHIKGVIKENRDLKMKLLEYNDYVMLNEKFKTLSAEYNILKIKCDQLKVKDDKIRELEENINKKDYEINKLNDEILNLTRELNNYKDQSVYININRQQ